MTRLMTNPIKSFNPEQLHGFFAAQGIALSGSHILVALSGGLDSVVLATALAGLRGAHNLTLTLAHVNHHLRDDSGRDEAFCRRLAADLDLPLRVAHLKPGSSPRGSVEAWARVERYRALAKFARQSAADWIVTAHHADDQAETVLMRLAQGSGLLALAGIRPRRGNLLRPLLNQSRATLAKWARRTGLEWIEDPSNSDTRFLRNRLRHDILTKLAREQPDSRAALLVVADLAGRYERECATAATALLTRASSGAEPSSGTALCRSEALLEASDDVLTIAVRRLLEDRLGEAIFLSRYHWQSFRHFVRVGRTGKVFDLSNTVKALMDRDQVLFYRAELDCLPEPKPLQMGLNRWNLHQFQVGPRHENATELPPLMIRPRRPGDRSRTGNSRHRLVSDLMTDARLNRLEKQRWPVLAGSNGELVWLPGLGAPRTELDYRGWRLTWRSQTTF